MFFRLTLMNPGVAVVTGDILITECSRWQLLSGTTQTTACSALAVIMAVIACLLPTTIATINNKFWLLQVRCHLTSSGSLVYRCISSTLTYILQKFSARREVRCKGSGTQRVEPAALNVADSDVFCSIVLHPAFFFFF